MEILDFLTLYWEIFYCLAVLILVFVGLVRNHAPDAILLGALVLVTIAGIVTPEEALVGFSNAGYTNSWSIVHRGGR